ncbi:MAG TPA: GNAT family N-acetyltransferase [Bryobacteraceae bacterium]|jgi:ribosomal protein S18 acetylase RimI-like enzyme|nr:GNAT family N-acetyltransferase [Bryobacteraceae bacterium]
MTNELAAAEQQYFTIRPAVSGDLPELARLFDDYRIFYQQASNRAGAEVFVAEQLEKEITRFFIARDTAQAAALGFVHLIPSLGTLAMRPIWYLEDLFVVPSSRRHGVARALMLRAEQFARENGAERLTLSTAHDNHAAQALYRSLGYVRDEHFWQFHRTLS